MSGCYAAASRTPSTFGGSWCEKSQLPQRPVRRVGRRRTQCPLDYLRNLIVVDGSRVAWAAFVKQAITPGATNFRDLVHQENRHRHHADDSLPCCAGDWLAISEMKHGLLLFQFGYHLPSAFDSELIADRTSDLAKSFNRLVDRRALVTHGELPCEERKTLCHRRCLESEPAISL